MRVLLGGRRVALGTLTVLVASLVLGVALRSEASEAPEAASWFPADTPIYLEIQKPGTLVDRLSSERLQAMLGAIPGYGKALESSQLKQARAVIDVIASQLETTPEAGLRRLTGGGITAALLGENKLVIAITSEDEEFLKRAHETVVKLAREDASKNGRPDPIQQKEYDGITAYSFDPNGKEAHAILGKTLLVASGGEMLKQVVDRIHDPKSAGETLAGNEIWQARRAAVAPESFGWAFVRLDRLRELDPKRFAPEKTDPGQTFLFGPWLTALRQGDWLSLSLTWTDEQLAAELAVDRPEEGYSKAVATYLPAEGQGAAPLLKPPGTIASISLWRDLSAIWEVRTDLLPPEAVQGLAQLDTFAGQFFGGRDFGSGVLGALRQDWRLVIAQQDVSTLKPLPDVKLPAFALVVGIDPEDEDFSLRLQAAYQSFIGLANLGAAQQQAPPLMLGSETVDDVTISTAHYVPSKEGLPEDEPVPQRFNFSPSAAQVSGHFILGSTTGITRDLVRALKHPEPEKASDATLQIEADGDTLAGLIEQNRERLVAQNMLDKGNDKTRAEGEIELLEQLVRYLGHGALSIRDTEDGPRLTLHFQLDAK